MPELFSQPDLQSFGVGASLNRVVSLVEPSFQPEAQPLAPPFTALPEMAGSLVANLVLSKSLLRSQGGLTDVYVRVLRIESESSLIRNLNHVNAVHVRSPGRSSLAASESARLLVLGGEQVAHGQAAIRPPAVRFVGGRLSALGARLPLLARLSINRL